MMAYESKLFSIGPEAEKRIHPEALKVLTNWERFELPMLQAGFTTADINEHLEDNEKAELHRRLEKIADGLRTCVDIGDGSSRDNQIKLSLFKLETEIPMSRIKQLLERAYDRKMKKAKEEQKRREEQERQRAAKAEEERERKEEEERWRAARRAVDPPTDDAKRYLDGPGEYDKFMEAAVDAIHIYLEKGGKYLDDYRTFDYRWLLDTINQRKDEEVRKVTAKSKAQDYNKRLSSEVARLRQSLCHSKKNPSSYFRKQVNDPRYLGYNFNHVLTDEDVQTYSVSSIAKDEISKLVPEDLLQFIYWEPWKFYFLLPSADYSFQGVPCLNFTFDVLAVVEIRMWLKLGQRSFDGYPFQFSWRCEGDRSVLVQEPEFLGYCYVIANFSDLNTCISWQSIPLVLLSGLLNGETKPDGTTISAASDGLITYKIPKFKEDVTIPDTFAEYLKRIGTIDRMVSIGIITEKVAGIVKNEERLPLQEEVKGGDTKKAMAVQLFNKGKRPSDPEVKSLGIKPNTAYRYYQNWKKVHHNNQNAI